MLKLVAAALLAALAFFMLIGFVWVSTNGSGPRAGGCVLLMTFLLTVGLPLAGAAALAFSWWRGREGAGRRRDELVRQSWAAELVRLAGRQGGKLTVVEAVAGTGLDAASAEATLADLHRRGVAEIELTDDGLVVYAFRDLQGLAGKATARPLLDA